MRQTATAPVEASLAVKNELSAMIEGFWQSQVIGVAVNLAIPDILAEGPVDYRKVAERADADPGAVLRLLRALQTLGICRCRADRTFELAEAGWCLCLDSPGSMGGRAKFAAGILWTLFSDLQAVVKSGRPTESLPTGRRGFDLLASHPDLRGMHEAMVESSLRAAKDISEIYDFTQFKTVLDVGGGYGGVLTRLLASHPGLAGAVLDLGYLEKDASGYFARAGVAERARFIGGDFFEDVPAGYDCYLLKYIIHDWDDEHALAILRRCGQAAQPAAKVLLIERPMPSELDASAEHRAIMQIDLAMMASGGKERDIEEYRALLAAAGLSLNAVYPTSSVYSLIEAVPASPMV